MALLTWSFMVVKFDVGVLTSSEYSKIFSPAVSLVI